MRCTSKPILNCAHDDRILHSTMIVSTYICIYYDFLYTHTEYIGSHMLIKIMHTQNIKNNATVNRASSVSVNNGFAYKVCNSVILLNALFIIFKTNKQTKPNKKNEEINTLEKFECAMKVVNICNLSYMWVVSPNLTMCSLISNGFHTNRYDHIQFQTHSDRLFSEIRSREKWFGPSLHFANNQIYIHLSFCIHIICILLIFAEYLDKFRTLIFS